MTDHYHGTPITPRAALETLAGRRFCVSWLAPKNLRPCLAIGRGVMIDNGAFSAWSTGRALDWRRFYKFAERHCGAQAWAVIPDVIDGDEAANDALLAQWPLGELGAPVWHMHESIARLVCLADRWPRICIGSSGAYRLVGSTRWHGRMVEAMNALCRDGGAPPARLHMLRGMKMAGSVYPFDSVDSTDIARNHKRRRRSPLAMARRWELAHCPRVWRRQAQQMALHV